MGFLCIGFVGVVVYVCGVKGEYGVVVWEFSFVDVGVVGFNVSIVINGIGFVVDEVDLFYLILGFFSLFCICFIVSVLCEMSFKVEEVVVSNICLNMLDDCCVEFNVSELFIVFVIVFVIGERNLLFEIIIVGFVVLVRIGLSVLDILS